MQKITNYFEKSGPQNTDELIKAVSRRVEALDITLSIYS